MKPLRPGPARGPVLTVLALATLALVGCEGGPTLPDDAPAGHTVNQDGVAHMPGLSQPEQSCAGCHGSDLRGGPEGEPSCFSCHGRKW